MSAWVPFWPPLLVFCAVCAVALICQRVAERRIAANAGAEDDIESGTAP